MIDPAMMAMMAGANQQQGAAPAPPGPAPQQPGGGDMGTGMSPAEHLRAAIEHAQAALVGEPNDAESQQLARVVQGLYQILAARQKQTDQVMGMGPGMRRALGG